MAIYRYQRCVAPAYPATVPNPPGFVVVNALPSLCGFAANPYLDVDFPIPALYPILRALILTGCRRILVALFGAVLLSRLAEIVLPAVFAFLWLSFFHTAFAGPDAVHGILALLAIQLPGVGAAYRPSASLAGPVGVSLDSIARQDLCHRAVIKIEN